MCAYEKDPSHLFEFAIQACAFDISTDLINEKYYNALKLDEQGDLEENSNVEWYMEEWNPSKEDHNIVEGLQDANLTIEDVLDMNENPIKVLEDQHDKVRNFIQLRAFESVNIVVPYYDDISDFLCIEGKWDVGKHHFDYDPIYDTDTENEVGIDSPFLQGITHDDIPIHIVEREDHGFPTHEVGSLEMEFPIYDIDDEGLVFPGLPRDPNSIAALSMSPCLGHSYIITIIDDPFSSPKYDAKEELSIRCIPPSPSYPQDCEYDYHQQPAFFVYPCISLPFLPVMTLWWS